MNLRTSLAAAVSFAALACNAPTASTPANGGAVTLEGPVTLAEPVKVESPVEVTLPGTVQVAGAVTVENPVAIAGPVTVQGEVGLAGPVRLQQPVEVAVPQTLKVVTAETDATRLVYLHGRVSGSTGPRVKLLEGPFVLTDAANGYTYSAQSLILYVNEGESCAVTGSPPLQLLAHLPDSTAAIHGARFFVPAGSSLCIHANSSIALADYTVSGFRPY